MSLGARTYDTVESVASFIFMGINFHGLIDTEMFIDILI
jgi:hypothetical protein